MFSSTGRRKPIPLMRGVWERKCRAYTSGLYVRTTLGCTESCGLNVFSICLYAPSIIFLRRVALSIEFDSALCWDLPCASFTYTSCVYLHTDACVALNLAGLFTLPTHLS